MVNKQLNDQRNILKIEKENGSNVKHGTSGSLQEGEK